MKYGTRSTRARLIVIVCSVLSATSAFAASNAASCRLAIGAGVSGVMRAYQSHIAQCLKYGNYGDCDPVSLGVTEAEYTLTHAMTADGSSCQAVADVSDLGWTQCPGDASSWRCSQPIDNLDDLDLCLRCLVESLGSKLFYDLDLPPSEPSSTFDRRCVRSTQGAVSKAIRAGLGDVMRCASANDPPACDLTMEPDSRFVRALDGIDRKVLKCRDPSGTPGQLGREITSMCNRTVTSTGDLVACMRQAAICQACMGANVALAQNQDCAALSGDPDCVYDPGKPRAGSFFVANRGDDTVTFFEPDGTYAFGTLASSSFATGPMPVSVAVGERTDTVVTVNAGGTVTVLRAPSGAPVAGDVASSTFTAGPGAREVLVHPTRDFLYVANAGDASVTYLDARDGSYAYGTFEASTFPVGNEPSSLAVNPDADILYVANAADGTVTFLDAITGAPWFGLLADSTFPAGAEPRSLSFMTDSWAAPALLVADAASGSLLSIDGFSGSPYVTFDGYATEEIGAGPVDLITSKHSAAAWSVSPSTQRLLTWSSYHGRERYLVDGTPSDVAVGPTEQYYDSSGYYLRDTPVLVTLSDTDQVQISETLSQLSNTGETCPAELSRTSPLDGYDHWVYSPVHDKFIGIKAVESAPSLIGVIDPYDFSVSQSFPSLTDSWYFTYGANHDDVVVASSDGRVLFLDAATGNGSFGTIAQSTFTCGCAEITAIASSDEADRVYLECNGYIVYMNATTGACIGGSPATTGGTRADVTPGVDEVGNRLLVAGDCAGASPQGGIIQLDPVVPQYLFGTLAASRIPASVDRCNYRIIRADGSGNLYAPRQLDYVYSTFDRYDTGGALLSLDYHGAVRAFDVDDVNGIVHLHEPGWPFYTMTYLDADTLQPLRGSLDRSQLKVLGGGLTVIEQPGTGVTLVAGPADVTAFRSDEVEYAIDHGVLGGTFVATGDEPSSIATMPAHTTY